MSKKNWTQEQRKNTLNLVAGLIKDAGGYSQLAMSGGISDFEKYLCLEIGCSIKVAHDYISVIRGAMIHNQRMADMKEEQKNVEGN